MSWPLNLRTRKNNKIILDLLKLFSQRELRGALAELQKMKHLYEKAVEQKEALARENKKLQG